jgi:hypothetical protein
MDRQTDSCHRKEDALTVGRYGGFEATRRYFNVLSHNVV